MESFTALTGIAAPLLERNIDTDVIIRIERILTSDRNALGPHALAPLRYHEDGSENPEFVLNREPFRRATILLAGDNFGCGSSREAAVWALWDFGIRCIIAPSFGDIFYGNCFQNGLLPITLAPEIITELATAVEVSQNRPITVDLEQKMIAAPDGTRFPFAIDAGRRDALLQGLDEIGQTLRREGEIAAFQAGDRLRRPWIYELPQQKGA
jgi:3-isopropylmalate/(R)-2-methylmalate dehydratase small subunit